MLAGSIDPALDSPADLAEAIDLLHAEDLRLEASSGLGSRLKALRGAVNCLEAESPRTLEVFDRTQAYEPGRSPSTSATAWTLTARISKVRQLLTRDQDCIRRMDYTSLHE
jgi:hypothetical protein